MTRWRTWSIANVGASVLIAATLGLVAFVIVHVA